MAKQAGPILVHGTVGQFTFYIMDGKGYVRQKSSLEGDRVKTSKSFILTMVYAGFMAAASRTAARLYRNLPREMREVSLYRKMTGTGQKLLKLGVPEDMLADMLADLFIPKPSMPKAAALSAVAAKAALDIIPPVPRASSADGVAVKPAYSVYVSVNGNLEFRRKKPLAAGGKRIPRPCALVG